MSIAEIAQYTGLAIISGMIFYFIYTEIQECKIPKDWKKTI
jgi:hypothetical protein